MSFHILLWQEGKIWVAKCLENSVASQGETQEEARKNLQEALELTFEDSTEEKINFPRITNIQTEELTLAA